MLPTLSTTFTSLSSLVTMGTMAPPGLLRSCRYSSLPVVVLAAEMIRKRSSSVTLAPM